MTDSAPANRSDTHAAGADSAGAIRGPTVPLSPPPEVRTAKVDGKLLRAAVKRHEDLSDLLARGPSALFDPDLVHDLRVSSRRLGEVARLLMANRTFMDKPTANAVDASLKALRRSMGDLRDADVTREHLLRWKMPGPLKKIARHIAESLESRRTTFESAARKQLASASLTGAMVVLARVLEDRARPECAADSEQLLRGIVESHLKKREKQMRRAFGKAARKQTAVSLHDARIAVKKLRYVMELAEAAGLRKGAKQQVRFLKQIQELLGDHHDTHVICEQIAAHLKDRRPARTPIKGLAPAWRKWNRTVERLQAQRAAAFFTKSYTWINA